MIHARITSLLQKGGASSNLKQDSNSSHYFSQNLVKDDDEEVKSTAVAVSKKATKRKKVPIQLEVKEVSELKNWRYFLENIEKMREKRDAPVDIMGCDRLSDETADPKVILHVPRLSCSPLSFGDFHAK